MAHPRFIHLRTHSEYSLLEGAIPLKSMPALCRAASMPALALTDTNALFAALEFSVSMKKEGIQPILGCQLGLKLEAPEHAAPEQARTQAQNAPALMRPLVLLAQNEEGYQNLLWLSSMAYLEAGQDAPHVTLAQLGAHQAGLICLSGGALGPLGHWLCQNKRAEAEALAKALAGLFGDRFYIELQRHPYEDGSLPEAERIAEPLLLDLAYRHDWPIVATNDAYFPNAEIYPAHDALLCISEGAYVHQLEPRRQLTPAHYFKSQEEMCALFADLPEALENTLEIAQRCAVMAHPRDPILPRFADNEVEELRRQANAGLQERLEVIPHAASREAYQERLDFELGIIEGMGFPGYFLIVADFIKWAKEQGIPVGPGRGSGAGSLVAYALTITDLDPLRYQLLFERFLNPERVSMPDFDIDFCMDRREEVIRYVQQKYGHDRVGQIITFGALLSKAAIRDVGRVLQMPYGQVDRLSKLIPVEGVKPVSITKALADEPRLREAAAEEPVVKEMLHYAAQLEGLLRNASTHAAGIVIGDRPLHELVPLYKDPRSDMPATQFNMKWVEQAGLVKFDFLGLKTLTVIQNALELLRARGIDITPETIPLDDPKTYALYASAKTVAVFQVESSGMMDALRQMKPNCIEDIVALVALYRPGPMENIPKYCKVKNKLEPRERLHPLIDHILDETQGIIVYQEQVMQIAQEMAGYSLGGADLLRRAMGKKIKEAMDEERPKFLSGAAQNGVDAAKANEVWDLLEKFANYGFNKSHAAAYAVVSYQTAWLKANYPVEFMAAVMNCDIHLTDKLSIYKREVDRLGLHAVPPCINRSEARFSVHEGALVYALGALKNVGVEAMRMIAAERHAGGAFRDLLDFASRVDLKRIGKRSLEMLARAGAFDQIAPNRAAVLAAIDALTAYSSAMIEAKTSAQGGLFGDAGEGLPPPPLPPAKAWSPTERLAAEHQAVGFYLSGHPLDDYVPALRRKRVLSYRDLAQQAEAKGTSIAKIAGTISSKQERKSARGNRFAFVQLSDPTGLYEVTVFSDTLEAAAGLLETGTHVVLTVEAEAAGDQIKLLARLIEPIEPVVADAGDMGLKIWVDAAEALPDLAAELAQSAAKRGSKAGPVQLLLTAPDLPGDVEIELPNRYDVTPHLRATIRHMPGVMRVEDF